MSAERRRTEEVGVGGSAEVADTVCRRIGGSWGCIGIASDCKVGSRRSRARGLWHRTRVIQVDEFNDNDWRIQDFGSHRRSSR
jgi:hypothetical protein